MTSTINSRYEELSSVEGFEMVQHEIKFSSDCNKRGMSPLHIATSEGREEAVSMLLLQGVDIHSVDNLGNTALHYCGHQEIALNLIESGADPTIRNKRGDAPLDLMKRRGVESQLISFMIETLQEIEQTTDDASDPLLPKTKKFSKRPSVKYVKSICTEFFAELGLKRLLIVMFVVLLLSLYFAFVITGFSKQRELRIPIDDETHKIEL